MTITFYCKKAMDKEPYPGMKVFHALDGKEWVEDFVYENGLQVFYEQTVIKIKTDKQEPPISEMCNFFVELGNEYYGGGDWPSFAICKTKNKEYCFEFEVWEGVENIHVQISDQTKTNPYFPLNYRYIDWENNKFYLDFHCKYETTIDEKENWYKTAKNLKVI